jgi:hypothetical protein
MANELKLTIELVPRTSWYNNMRKVLPQSDWDKIRKRTYAEYGHRCGICGFVGKLNCHEIWHYDDQNRIQKLAGFIALCDLCHHVKHIGLADILASRGELDFDKVVEHFLQVNECNKETFEQHHRHAFEQWRERSKYEWRIDLGEYEGLVQNKSKK